MFFICLSYSPSVLLFCQRNSSEPAQLIIILVKLCSCVDVHIRRKFWFNFFPGSYAPLELRNSAKMKYTTKTFCYCNPSETVYQNLMKPFFSYICRNLLFEIFLREKLELNLAKIYYFMQLVWNRFSMNDREAVQSDIFLKWSSSIRYLFDSDCPNITQMWQL